MTAAGLVAEAYAVHQFITRSVLGTITNPDRPLQLDWFEW